MRLFIAGICGSFMAGIAQLAKESGHQVRGCDIDVYPPMSDLLRAQQIEVVSGYRPEHLSDPPDIVLIGNVLTRGNPLVEHVLNHNITFQSGPEWLRKHVLSHRKVIAVAGTHGKTSTASMLTWILECAGLKPGYMIGGKPGNFAQSARLGEGEYFIIEADEYDTAFFDKRSKFVHYHPQIAILNNLEFDHADIFDDIGQIVKQFHHLVRIVPGNGCVVVNADDEHLAEVLKMGCWSDRIAFGSEASTAEWRAVPVCRDASIFDVLHLNQTTTRVNWACIGVHNMQNALAAITAATVAGVHPEAAGKCLDSYIPVARRLQLLFHSEHVSLYDDFAHHPTAIAHTIEAVRAQNPTSYLIAIVELRSNSMRMGVHGVSLSAAIARADCAMVRMPDDDPQSIIDELPAKLAAHNKNCIIITMSNGSFGGLPKRIAEYLHENYHVLQ